MITLTETPQGLVISFTDRAAKKEFIERYGKDNPQPNLFDLLDEAGYIGNDWDDGTDMCSFAMTSAPIILKGAYMSEETGLFDDADECYYFGNYALENEWETLIKTGSVVFTRL